MLCRQWCTDQHGAQTVAAYRSKKHVPQSTVRTPTGAAQADWQGAGINTVPACRPVHSQNSTASCTEWCASLVLLLAHLCCCPGWFQSLPSTTCVASHASSLQVPKETHTHQKPSANSASSPPSCSTFLPAAMLLSKEKENPAVSVSPAALIQCSSLAAPAVQERGLRAVVQHMARLHLHMTEAWPMGCARAVLCCAVLRPGTCVVHAVLCCVVSCRQHRHGRLW